MKTRRPLYLDWLTKVTAGEFLGFLTPSLVGVMTFQLQVPQTMQAGIMIIAGMAEGCVLGHFQGGVLAKHIAGLQRQKWVIATTLGAGVAWLIGMLPSTISGPLNAVPL